MNELPLILTRKIYWSRKGRRVVAVILLCIGAAAAGYEIIRADKVPMVTYQKEVIPGDTIWSICSRVATEHDDLQKLVWETMQLNHIENAGDLQPGTVINIRVREVKP